MRAVLRLLPAALGLLVIWQAVVSLTGVTPFILPGPLKVAEALWASRALIAENAVITAVQVLLGMALGATLGGLTALGLAMSPRLARMVLPGLLLSQAVPYFALAPILALWLGFGMASKIAMAVLIIFFPVTSAFYDGLRRTDPGLLDLAQVMGAGNGAVLWRLRLPAALPAFASGLRLAAVYAPIGAVIGEWVGGASGGLGYLMLLANGRVKIDLMFASLVVLALFTVLLYAAVNRLANRLERWAAGG
ncbi:MAG: ABC transporter permease [Pseudomonadota bacterium]